jgi:hypothetical protein
MSLQYKMWIIGSVALMIFGTYLLYIKLYFLIKRGTGKSIFLWWVLFMILMFVPGFKSIFMIMDAPTLSIAHKILFVILEAIIYYINWGIALFIRFKILDKK